MDSMVYIIVRRDNENGVDENFKVFLNEDTANECLSSLEEEFENVYCDSGFYKYEFFIEQHEIEERYSRKILSTSIQYLKEYAEKYMADELKEKYAASKEMVQDDVDYCINNIVGSYLNALEDIRNTYLSHRDTSWMK